MVFSSSIFLFFFLPVVVFMYYVPFRNCIKAKNVLLLVASLFFYAWGEPVVVFLMILSILANYFFALIMKENNKKVLLIISVIFNLSFLFVFKYLDFTLKSVGSVLSVSLPMFNIALPIGISFYTFQAMSYVIDVYRKDAQPQRNPLYVGLYIALFPQLIAGPIVRYTTIEDQILGRKESLTAFSDGVERFIIGLAKKMIIANNMGFLADTVYAIPSGELSTAFAWLGAIAYTLQIYFDFSAYSDMAIGLGKMFGFEFEENFNYPYISKSVTEFWRRWHISLSTWFRDYLYIPLGGNRVGKARHIFNLFVVWFCTGLWHGANWTFIAWGMYFFIFLMIEKFLPLSGILKYVGNVYTLLIVMISWVLFRSNDIGSAINYIGTMFTFDFASFTNSSFVWYLCNFAFFIVVGIIFSTPIAKKLTTFTTEHKLVFVKNIVVLALFMLAVSFMFRSSYNPFIYFNF